MLNDLPDDALTKQVLQGEGWLLNSREGTFIQFKPDSSKGQVGRVMVRTFRWAPVLGDPIREQSLLAQAAIDMWINLQSIGWNRCSSPVS